MNVEFTEAEPTHVVGIVYVQASSWIDNYQNPLAKISEEDIRSVDFESKISEWQHMLKSPNYQIWIASRGQEVLAFLAMRKDSNGAEIYQQHTLPSYQRQGLGGQLLKMARDWAGDMPISLRIPAYAQSGLDFYRQSGFQVDETGEVDFIRLPSGAQIPTVIMRLQSGQAEQSKPPVSSLPVQTKATTTAPSEIVSPAKPTGLVGRAKLAKISGMRASTIKYYSEIGLLPFEQTEARLARRYHRQTAHKRLKTIQRLRRAGKSITDIKAHFQAEDDN